MRWFSGSVAVVLMLCVCGLARAEESSSVPSLGGSLPTTTPSMILSAGAGFAVYSGDFASLYNSGSFGYTMSATVLGQLTDAPLYAGVDFGLNFWGFDTPTSLGPNHSLSAVGIQVLPAIVYRFTIDTVPKLTPFFGFALGPNFYIVRDRVIVPGSNAVNSNNDTHIYLELLAKPGVEYHFTDNVAAAFEPKFGLLNFQLIFMPTAALTLTL